MPVGVHAGQRAEAPSLGSHSRAPVHGGAKDVEREGMRVAQVGQRNTRTSHGSSLLAPENTVIFREVALNH
jgi:hypothetical protein